MTDTAGLRERGAAMVERVTLECSVVMSPEETAEVKSAVAAALRARDAVYDDHDPRYLHPARTVLILLADAGTRDADVLAAAAFVESLPHVQADPTILAPAARTLAAAAPVPDESDDLLERLVTADTRAALIALAERLDHARHLHQMPDIPPEPFHATIESIYVPVAARISPPIARRLQKWAGAFARRHLGKTA